MSGSEACAPILSALVRGHALAFAWTVKTREGLAARRSAEGAVSQAPEVSTCTSGGCLAKGNLARITIR